MTDIVRAAAYVTTVNEPGGRQHFLCIRTDLGRFLKFEVDEDTLKRLAAETTHALWGIPRI